MDTRRIILISVLTSLATMAVVAAAAWLLMPGFRAHLALDTQRMQVRLPDGAPVRVDIVEPIETDLDTVIDVSFPIDEVLPIHFEAPLRMNVGIDAEIPMQTVIKFEDTLPLDAEVTASIFGFPVKVPVQGDIPVKLYVPIDQMVPVKFNAPVTVTMTEELEVPVKVDFETQIPLNQSLSIPIRKPLETNIQMSDRPVTVEMSGSELVVPLDRLRLERRGDDD